MFKLLPNFCHGKKVAVLVEGAENGQKVSWAPIHAGLGSTLKVLQPVQAREFSVSEGLSYFCFT